LADGQVGQPENHRGDLAEQHQDRQEVGALREGLAATLAAPG
jgi:hypothetical protein